MYETIPEYTKSSIDNYVNHGIPVGGFLNAVFCNDLVGAICRADQQNLMNLKEIVQYMYNKMPSNSWGNQKKVDSWIEKGGLMKE